MLTRKNDTILNFDFEKVKEQSKDNPVFYVQYAHARCCSVIRKAEETFGKIEPSIANLSNPQLRELAIKLSFYSQIIDTAVKNYEPHLLISYIIEVASQFHSIWNSGFKFVDSDIEKTKQNLAFIFGVKNIISSVLNVCNIMSMEKM
jgi:arginyl-tRNA synthetase